MYIDVVPNRNSPPAILLRESYRVDGKVKKRTLLNLTDWPPDLIEGFRALLKGGTALPPGQDAIVIKRSLPHGHVAAVLGTLRKIGLDRLLGPVGNGANRCRDLAVAMIVARLIAPLSNWPPPRPSTRSPPPPALAKYSVWGRWTRTSSTRRWTGCSNASRRSKPRWHVATSKTAPSCCMTSHRAILRGAVVAQFGFNRDGKRGKLQIVYGLLCAPD